MNNKRELSFSPTSKISHRGLHRSTKPQRAPPHFSSVMTLGIQTWNFNIDIADRSRQ